MSAVEDCSELKGGHPPAVKAGGMRITQHKPAGSTHEKAPELKKDDGEDVVEEVSPSDHEFTEERKGPKFSLEPSKATSCHFGSGCQGRCRFSSRSSTGVPQQATTIT
ncbi:hypothetical protein MRX96_005298 [Rhipicephalus microplus]